MFDERGALLLVVFVTTIATPPLLRRRLGRRGAQPAPPVNARGLRATHPLVLSNGTVELAAPMPPGRALDVALEAALSL